VPPYATHATASAAALRFSLHICFFLHSHCPVSYHHIKQRLLDQVQHSAVKLQKGSMGWCRLMVGSGMANVVIIIIMGWCILSLLWGGAG